MVHTRAHEKFSRFARIACTGLAVLALQSCREDALIEPINITPVADARLLNADGKPIDETTDGGSAMLQIPLTGATVEVTLDGSRSHDEDGTIVTYRWLSGTAVPEDGGVDDEDGGVMAVRGRLVPKDQSASWPSDEMRPKVTLTQGVWTFTLWVTDDEGAISAPNTLQIIVGEGSDPAVAECVEQVFDSVPDACKNCVCSKGEACRAAVVESACDEICWGLITCVATNCPDFAAMAAMMPPDYSCVNAACLDFLGGATPAMAAGDCAVQCTDECQ